MHHGLCHADRLGRAQLELLLKVRLLKRAVTLGKGVALQLVIVAQQVLGILLGDGGMQTIGLRHGVHKDRLRMSCLVSSNSMGCGVSSLKPTTVQTPDPDE